MIASATRPATIGSASSSSGANGRSRSWRSDGQRTDDHVVADRAERRRRPSARRAPPPAATAAELPIGSNAVVDDQRPVADRPPGEPVARLDREPDVTPARQADHRPDRRTGTSGGRARSGRPSRRRAQVGSPSTIAWLTRSGSSVPLTAVANDVRRRNSSARAASRSRSPARASAEASRSATRLIVSTSLCVEIGGGPGLDVDDPDELAVDEQRGADLGLDDARGAAGSRDRSAMSGTNARVFVRITRPMTPLVPSNSSMTVS